MADVWALVAARTEEHFEVPASFIKMSDAEHAAVAALALQAAHPRVSKLDENTIEYNSEVPKDDDWALVAARTEKLIEASSSVSLSRQ